MQLRRTKKKQKEKKRKEKDKMDPVFLAMSKLRRRKFDDCAQICTELLAENPYDRAVWFMKTRALTLSNWIDDTEMEEEGVAEMLMDDNAMAQAPRPGTSLSKPGMSGTAMNQGVRPMSSAGRPRTGFARPGTSSRGGTSGSVKDAMGGLAQRQCSRSVEGHLSTSIGYKCPSMPCASPSLKCFVTIFCTMRIIQERLWSSRPRRQRLSNLRTGGGKRG